MTYTEPKTWTNEPLVANDMNIHIRDNIDALKNPPSNNSTINESANYSTSSASWANVDATDTEGKLRLTITTYGGDVMIHFECILENGTSMIDFSVDGVRYVGDDGIYTAASGAGVPTPISFTRLVTGLAAGAHIFRIMWKAAVGTVTMYAGAGTANRDLHPHFWVREVS